MAKLNGNIPPELMKAESELKETISRTEAFINKHRKVFEQFQDLVNERNAGIEECSKMCKQNKCSTELFQASMAKNVKYDAKQFLEKFGPETLAECCNVVAKKVNARIETGQLKADEVDEAIYEDKPTMRVRGPSKWVID